MGLTPNSPIYQVFKSNFINNASILIEYCVTLIALSF